jgi:hypothetical protein
MLPCTQCVPPLGRCAAPALLSPPTLPPPLPPRTQPCAGTIDSQNQARDSAEDQRKRFALEELGGLSLEDRRRRLAREVAALQVNVAPALERGVWWRVRNGIREGGTIRYDLDGLTATVGDKARRRKLVAQQDAAMKALEELDFFAVKRDKAQAQRAFQDAVAKLEGLVGALG